MTNIDSKAAIAAIEALVPLDWTGHVTACGYTEEDPDCGCFTLPSRFAAAVDAARAEGDKQGAARVREAVEAVLRSAGYGGALEPFSPELIQRVRAALTEAAPHD